MSDMQQAKANQTVKCLLVDDLEENLVALSALLRHDDIELLQARSGTEALELLLLNDVALAFIDVQMPDMDGFELAELIRGSDRTRHIPLIFVTAGDHNQHRLFQGYETGAVDFLYKPIEPIILKNKAEVFFQLYRQKQQLAQELQEKTETLRLNEMLVAVIGHDLRNPLSAILMGTKLLQRRYSDEVIQRTTKQITDSGLRMGRMIMDILDLARARLSGGIPLTLASSNLALSFEQVISEYQTTAPDQAITLLQEGDFNGEWDSERLAQVASNLIGNAIQHGKNGGVIQIRLDGADTHSVVCSIENEGTIPAELRPHIFDPFRGGQRENGRNQGLGLGLYIVQEIVAAHQGTIEIYSDDDASRTRVQVTIPRFSQ